MEIKSITSNFVDDKSSLSKCFVKCLTYNVVLVGDSRVGKSTFIEQLQQYIPEVSNSPYRGTILPEIKTLYLYDEDKIMASPNIVVNMLDTPGLDEKPIDGVERPNEQLRDLISGHIKENFSSIDLILITIQRKGITDILLKSIYDMKEYFGNKYLCNICLLITHCDNFNEIQEKEYISALISNEEMGDFCNAIKNRVIFTGKGTNEIKLIHTLDFLNEQTRRKKKFLKYLSESIKINLKTSANLEDLRPIDVLESAASTNKIILKLPIENKENLEEIMKILNRLRELKLNEEDGDVRDDFINSMGDFLKDFKLKEVTNEEIEDAKRYNNVEIPLKRKAENLKSDSYQLKTHLNSLKTSYNRLKLEEAIIETPKKIETEIKTIGLKRKQVKK